MLTTRYFALVERALGETIDTPHGLFRMQVYDTGTTSPELLVGADEWRVQPQLLDYVVGMEIGAVEVDADHASRLGPSIVPRQAPR